MKSQSENSCAAICERVRGSSQSRQASFSRLNERTAVVPANAGKNHHMWRVEEVVTRIIQHHSATRYRREDAGAEEAERASRVDRAVALHYE